MAASKSYKYVPLESKTGHHTEFRLMTLFPGAEGSELHCTIQHAPLASPPPYESLSYTWGDPKSDLSTFTHGMGDPTSMYPLKVGDQGEGLSIGHNLFCALQEIRKLDEERVLWVDAICINQDDDDERSQQVTWMATVYGNAMRVLAWLGKEDVYTNLAFDTIDEICWATKVSVWRYISEKAGIPINEVTDDLVASDNRKMSEGKDPTNPNEQYCLTDGLLKEAFQLIEPLIFDGQASLDELALLKFGEERPFALALINNQDLLDPRVQLNVRLDALAEIFDFRSYWRRLWIVQELIHAKAVTLICGTRNIDMAVFSVVTLALVPLRSSPFPILLSSLQAGGTAHEFQTAIVRTGHLAVQRHQPKMHLSNALEDFGLSLCSELRDRIYALLNICQPIPINVDYQADIATIYSSSIKEIINQDRRVDILFRKPRYNDRKNEVDLPSWTPKLYQPLIGGVLGYSPRWGERDLYNACGHSRKFQNVVAISDPSILPVSGYFVDKIIRATRMTPNKLSYGDHANVWSTVLWLRSTIPPDTPDHVFWETLVVGTYPKKTPLVGRMAWDVELLREYEAAVREALEDIEGASWNLLEYWRSMLFRNTFCHLEGGGLAMVDGEAEEGDMIFVAVGAGAPMVLRPPVGKIYNVDRDGGWLTETTLVGSKSWIKRLWRKIRKGKSRKEVAVSVKEKEKFGFVGGAYVNGIMDGEAMEANTKSQNEEKVIWLV